MDFLLSADLVEFQRTLREFFTARVGSADLRSHLIDRAPWTTRSEYQSKLWNSLSELGVFISALPESNGGLELGLLSLAISVSEGARVLAPVPLFETAALGIVPLLMAKESDERSNLLNSIAEKASWLTGGKVDAVPTLALSDGAVLRDSGKEEIELFYLSNEDLKSVTQEIRKSLDLLRPYSKLSLSLPAGKSLGKVDATILNHRISVLACSELIGVSRRALELTVDYVSTRKQFGAPIGSFQAIQHKLADVLLSIDSAEALTRFAAWSADHDPRQFVELATAAKGYCSDVLPRAIESTLQAHGGIGFTYEYDLHLYLRRAQMAASLFGTADECYQKIATHLLAAA